MNNCAFLVSGICPYHTRSCDKICDKYSVVGDDKKPIFHDWNSGIEKLAIELRLEYFGNTEKLSDSKTAGKQIPKDGEFDEDDFLGE